MSEHRCERCSKLYRRNSNAQKYCKLCAYIVHLEGMRRIRNKKRQKEEGFLGPHPIKNKDGSININAERRAILKELTRLGLRK